MSKSLVKHAATTPRRLGFLRARFAAAVLALTLAGSLAGTLSATSGVVSANGGSGAGGDPGNGIVLAAASGIGGCGTACGVW